MRRLLLASVLLVPACTLGPDFTSPVADLPQSWSSHTAANTRSQPTAEPVDPQWWSVFGDPTLTKLASRVAAENLDVRVAALRLAESRAQRGVAASALFPAANANASYTREQISEKGASSLFSSGAGGSSPATQSNGIPNPSAGKITEPFDIFQYGSDASWELDLWGRVRRSVESADAAVTASAETQRDVLVSMIAELARDYVNLRGVQDTLRITRENLATARETAKLTRTRSQGGLTTDLDVASAEAQVAQTESELPPLEQQEAALINAIAFLLGQPPGTMTELRTPRPPPLAPVRVPVGLPSELARRRPDIRQADARLHGATADIGTAEADFYPRITLSGSFAFQALQLKDLGDFASRTYGFGPSISVPIFDGGRLRSTLELRKLQQKVAAVNFQRTVLQAWREIDDAMQSYDSEQRRASRIAAQVANSRRALSLARSRYTQGLSDYLEVLTAQRNLLTAQSSLANSHATTNANLVSLYRALGGGWQQAFPEEIASK
jgi:NodT family efflux transporter outer membrane factor (OMF) lipoprotein